MGTPHEICFFWIKSVHQQEHKEKIVCARTQIAKRKWK
jgi:hypothetical protein